MCDEATYLSRRRYPDERKAETGRSWPPLGGFSFSLQQTANQLRSAEFNGWTQHGAK